MDSSNSDNGSRNDGGRIERRAPRKVWERPALRRLQAKEAETGGSHRGDGGINHT